MDRGVGYYADEKGTLIPFQKIDCMAHGVQKGTDTALSNHQVQQVHIHTQPGYISHWQETELERLI